MILIGKVSYRAPISNKGYVDLVRNVAKGVKNAYLDCAKRVMAYCDANLDERNLKVQLLADDLAKMANLEVRLASEDVGPTAIPVSVSCKPKKCDAMNRG